MKIVVLGGNGELGSYLCPKLAQLGHEVFAVCNDDLPPYTPAHEWDKITTLVHNRTTMDQESAGSYGSAVAALQAQVVVDACCYEDFHSKLLVDSLQASSSCLSHFIHCGNLRVYNPTVVRPWKEDGPRGVPCGYYTLQQQLMETRLLTLSKTSNFPATVVLMGELVGEGWCPVTFQGLYDPSCFQAFAATPGWFMMPKQPTYLQFLDVHDAVSAICAMIDKPAKAIGQSWNLCTLPILLQHYVQGIAAANGWPKPQMRSKECPTPAVEIRERKWIDFSYAIDKAQVHLDVDSWDAPDAADLLWRRCQASPQRAAEVFGCSFRSPVESLARAARWCIDNYADVKRPRMPRATLVRGEGRLPPFLPVDQYSGTREGYIYKNGRLGRGYYLDLGPYIDWQMQTWRRIAKSDATSNNIDIEKQFDRLVIAIVVMNIVFVCMAIYMVMFYEGSQGFVVYMTFVSSHWFRLPRLVPKPFTSSLRIEGPAEQTLGVWHNLLPPKGYKGQYSDDEKAVARNTCRTLLYFHGNGENRNNQAWKQQWYHEHADAHVVTFDYRGFGDSSCAHVAFSVCPTEVNLYEDAMMMFEMLTNSTSEGGYGVDPACVVFHGHSLGSAVAVRVASKLTEMKKPIGGLILEAPLTSIADVAMTSGFSPIAYLPVALQDISRTLLDRYLHHHFKSDKWLHHVSSPTLILHGQQDLTVPASHGRSLYEQREGAGDSLKCADKSDYDVELPCTDIHLESEAGHQDVLKSKDAQVKVLSFVNEVWRAGAKASQKSR